MLFQYMDDNTILVGHALQNDLNVLGGLHSIPLPTDLSN